MLPTMLISGESLLNDGTAIVLFSLFKACFSRPVFRDLYGWTFIFATAAYFSTERHIRPLATSREGW